MLSAVGFSICILLKNVKSIFEIGAEINSKE